MYDSVEKQTNTVERLRMTRTVYGDQVETVCEISEDDIATIQPRMANLNLNDFQTAANYVRDAENIYVVANRSAVSLGVFLQYYLEIMFGNSELINSRESAFERM